MKEASRSEAPILTGSTRQGGKPTGLDSSTTCLCSRALVERCRSWRPYCMVKGTRLAGGHITRALSVRFPPLHALFSLRHAFRSPLSSSLFSLSCSFLFACCLFSVLHSPVCFSSRELVCLQKVSCSCGVLVCGIGHVLMVGGSSLWDLGTVGFLGACLGERNCVSTEFSCCCRGDYDVTSFLCIFVVLPAICPNGARCTASSGPSFPMFLEVGLMTRQQLCLKSS